MASSALPSPAPRLTTAEYLAIGEDKYRHKYKIAIAVTLAAVTLRLWLPVLLGTHVPFDTAYPIVAWLCWVPNLLVAEAIVRRTSGPRAHAPARPEPAAS